MSYILPKIETKEDFDELLLQLFRQGFEIHPSDSHTGKLEQVVSDANSFRFFYNRQLKYDLWARSSGSYLELARLAKEHFSKFTKEDQIRELLRYAYVKKDSVVHCNKPLAEIQQNPPPELLGYELSKEADHGDWLLYDLTGDSLRVSDYYHKLPQLLRLTIAPNFLLRLEPRDVYQWKSVGAVQYQFLNDFVIEFKHPQINTLKLLYKEYALSRPGTAVKI